MASQYKFQNRGKKKKKTQKERREKGNIPYVEQTYVKQKKIVYMCVLMNFCLAMSVCVCVGLCLCLCVFMYLLWGIRSINILFTKPHLSQRRLISSVPSLFISLWQFLFPYFLGYLLFSHAAYIRLRSYSSFLDSSFRLKQPFPLCSLSLFKCLNYVFSKNKLSILLLRFLRTCHSTHSTGCNICMTVLLFLISS